MTTHDALIELGEMLAKFQQTANRSLRKMYAERAKQLLKVADKGINKKNPEEYAGFRSLRNQWIVQLDYQFPELQRPEELAEFKKTGLGEYCFGVIENTFISGCNWYTLAGVGGLLYLLGRAHQKALKKKRARMARMRRLRSKKSRAKRRRK